MQIIMKTVQYKHSELTSLLRAFVVKYTSRSMSSYLTSSVNRKTENTAH